MFKYRDVLKGMKQFANLSRNVPNVSQNRTKALFLTSILLALFIDTKILNLIILAAFPSLSGVMAAMYFVIVLVLFIIGIFFQRRSLTKLRLSYIGICLLCILWYTMTDVFVATPSVSVPFFCIFMVAAFLIPGIIRIDMRTFLLTLLIIPSLGVMYLNRIFLNEILEEGTVSMGTCYALLIPVLGDLVYLRFYYRKESKLMKILMLFFAAIYVFYLIQMAMFGSRGPILCVVSLILSFFIIRIDDNRKISFSKGKTFIIIITLIFLISSFTAILLMLQDFLATFDISLNVIDKFLRLEDNGDMTNGREVLSQMAWDGIMASPIWGNGTSQFLNNTGEVYPHNFLIQMLYDGGIILTSLVLFPLIRTLTRKIRVISAEEFICLLLFFFASVPGALFSGDLWNADTLWMCFGFILSRNSFYTPLNVNR